MNFVENTGHTFTLKSYSQKPIGHEYENMPYIFWMDSDKTRHLSIDNYYVRIINMLIPIHDENDISNIGISVECTSSIYRLISTKQIQDSLNSNSSIASIFCRSTQLDETSDLRQALNDDDLIGVIVSDNGTPSIVVPIYVIGCSSMTGVLSTNILIHVFNKDTEIDACDESWTPVTVAGEWFDENEPLYINAANMGITLPKDILHAVYQCSFVNDEFDYEMYNIKLKEYLINYMQIRGEAGNFNSAISSLQWFGYGDKITISKLLRTDNEFQRQYVRDYFNISNDILESFSTFRNSTMISLSMKENTETKDTHKFDFSGQFFGEGHPVMKSLFDTYERVQVGSEHSDDDYHDEAMYFMKPYYDYCFYEMGLKLSALKYYYDRYFLPIHLIINSLSIEHKVYANDIKYAVRASDSYSEHIIDMSNMDNSSCDVEICSDEIQYLTHQVHYVDDSYIEHCGIYDDDAHVYYYINDTCTNIPIKFKSRDKYYNCVLLLTKYGMNEEVPVYETHFSVYQHNDQSTVKSFVIYPQQQYKPHDIRYFIDSVFVLHMCVNNKWISKRFTIKMPELSIDFGKLKYNYYDDVNNIFTSFNQLSSITDDTMQFNSFMYAPQLVTTNSISFIDDIIRYYNTNNIQYIDSSMIDKTEFYRYIVYDNVKIYIHNSLFSKNITIFESALQNTENMMMFIKDNNQYILKKRNDNDVYEMTSFFVGTAQDDSYTFDYYKEDDIKHILTYNELNNTYSEDSVIYEINYANYSGSSLMDKYQTIANIAPCEKYLNSMHVFNIYRKKDNIIPEEQFKLYNNYELKFDGITFYRPNNSSYISIMGMYDETMADTREYDAVVTDTRDYHADLYNSWDTNLTRQTKSFGYYITDTGQATTQILSYTIETTPLEGYVIYNSLYDMKIDNRSKIHHDGPQARVTSHKNSDGFVEYFCDNDGNILNFYAKYWHYNDGWIKDYVPYNSDIEQFINALRANDNTYKIELHFNIVRKKYSKHLNKYVHVDNNDVVETDGKYYMRNTDIELVATDEIKYYDADTNHYISTKYPTMHWNVTNNDVDDVNMFWNDATKSERYTYNIDINTYDSSPYWPDTTYSLNNKYCQRISGLDGTISISITAQDNQAPNISSISIVACVNDETTYIATGSDVVDFDVQRNDTICAYLQVRTDVEYNDNIRPHVIFNRHTVSDEPLRYTDIEHIDSSNAITIGDYMYGDNTSESVIQLYNDFFYKTPLFMKFYGFPMHVVNENKELSLGLNMKYDFYLMHDMDYWYGVYISRDTIDKVLDVNDISIKRKVMDVTGLSTNTRYIFKHVKSSTQFLVNRMKYIPACGKNHFMNDDIIVARLANNSRLPVNMCISAKWNIKPLSLGASDVSTMTSSTEMAILDIPKNDSRYKRGYYDVSVHYSVDKNTQQQYTKRACIRID